jgi:hypothetical protein
VYNTVPLFISALFFMAPPALMVWPAANTNITFTYYFLPFCTYRQHICWLYHLYCIA